MSQKISDTLRRICKGCGQEFKPHARKQFYCGEVRQFVCAVCGKEFEAICSNQTKSTCSTECQANLIKQKRSQSAAKVVKLCKWCGAEFTPTSARDVYCKNIHYQTCVICGKQFEIDVRRDSTVKTCSKTCKNIYSLQQRDTKAEHEKQKATLVAKYGVDNAAKIPGVVDRIKQTNVERYGSEWYTQTDEYKKRVKATDLKIYGVDHHLKAQSVKDKRTNTVQSLYGVDNVFQLDDVKKQSRITLLDLYGVEYISQSDAIQSKITETNLNKYGVKHPMMLKEFQDKAKATNLKKYGRYAFTQKHISNITNWYLFINDPRAYIQANYETTPRSAELAEDLGVDQSTIDIYLSKHGAADCVRRAKSLMELEVCQFIQSICNTPIIQNDRTVIGPNELDIYLPEYKMAIECNPTVTHNSSVPDPWGGECKPRNYHLLETNECEHAGIFLFHIFGSEWSYHRPVIESMIRNLLGCCKRKIYARKCNIQQIDAETCRNFLNINHRQGNVNSPIRLGLYFQDELVSVMTFGRMRNSIGTDSTDLSDCYELVRFCSALNTSVIGGASKLFKYFVNDYQPARIRSFSDKAHTRGKLYETLGFTKVRTSTPGYVWVDSTTDISYHRYSAQKHNLKRFLKDDNVDLDKTEKQIMEEHGFVQVFDCGTVLWEWKAE